MPIGNMRLPTATRASAMPNGTSTKQTVTYTVEVTDLYGGEANYSWVRRHTIILPWDASQAAIVRQAKAAQGWSGHKCDTTTIGERSPNGRMIAGRQSTIEVRPRGKAVVMFIDPKLEE